VFSPIICRRSMSGLESAGSSKIQRWQHIIQEAAEQSGRTKLPKLLPIRSFVDALSDISQNTLAIMPWEEEHSQTLHDVLNSTYRSPEDVEATLTVARSSQTPPTIVIFIGPEGGLTAEEVALAQSHDVQIVTLGARILRAETAAIATVANVMYECEWNR
jgi:16S rRNA (uracil1498-N3)-methyltransferase